MKKALLTILACVVLLVTAGCTITEATVPLVYTNNQNTEFEILGTVAISNATRRGYIELFNEAKRLYPDTDFVIDIMIDQEITTISYHWFVYFFKLLFGTEIGRVGKEQVTYNYVMRGTAIKYIKQHAL